MEKKSQTKEQLLEEIDLLRKRVQKLEGAGSTTRPMEKVGLPGNGKLSNINEYSKLLLDTTIDAYVIVDTKGDIQDINQSYVDLIGYTRKELLGMNIRQLVANKSSKDVDEQIQYILSKGKGRFESLHRHKDGQLIDLEASLRALEFEERPLIVGFMRDITDRKKALEALKDSEYLLRESQQVARLGSYKLDFSEGYWQSSEILDEIFGIDKSYQTDVQGWLEIIHPDDRDRMQKYFENLLAKRKVHFNAEYRIRRINDQRELWVHGLGELEYGEDGTPLKMLGTIQDITERKRVDEELQLSELRFRTIIEEAADALFINDFEGKILEVNNRACENLGYSRDELLSMHIGEIDMEFNEGSKDPGNSMLSNLKLGKSLHVEITHRRKNGTSYPAEASLCIIELNHQKVILGFVRDISKRKFAEEGLLKMSKAIDNSSEVIFLTDIEGIITYMNPEFTKMYGYTAEEVVGKVTPRIIKSGLADPGVSEYLWNTLLSKQIIPSSQYVNKRKDGEYIDVEGSAAPILDEKGDIIGFLGIQRDITKRKRDEQIQGLLFQISNAANTSDNLNHLIAFIQKELGKVIDTSNFYVALYDELTDILSFPSFLDEQTEARSIYAGDTLSNYVITTERPMLLNRSAIRKLVRTGIIEESDEKVEQWLGVPLKFKGKVTGVLAVQSYKDRAAFNEADMQMLEFVSDQISISIYHKKAEQDLVVALEKATESDRLKSAFLASMSHELRTPLNAIIGFSDIFSEDLSADEMMNYAQIINSSGNQLLSIVEDLFDITLIEAGEVRIRKREEKLFPIMEYIFEIIDIERKSSSKEHVALKLSVAPELRDLSIQTDTVKLRQILINLLKNAIKFTSEGRVDFGYTQEQDEKQSFIKFHVKDTGLGIPMDKREVIFDVFRQIEDSNTRTLGGTGIGLSIAKKMTELLGGKIWLDSEEGKGSEFYFTIPLANDQEEEGKQVRDGEALNAGKDLTKEGLVLIVEDDVPSMNFLKVLLNKLSLPSLWASSGLEAIKFCKENPNIDVVLMDINMPEMDGYEATREIKKFKPELAIIAQTANAVAGDLEKALEAGCNDYISKPIKKEVLKAMLEKHLSQLR